MSGLSRGGVTVNYAAFTIFLFPLSLGYAIVKHDLFEIDAFVKRGVFYLALTAVITVVYLGVLAFLNLALQATHISRSPLFPLLFTLGIVLLLNPLREYVQRGVDRVFFRVGYDPQKELETTSTSLASIFRLDDILPRLWQSVCTTMHVSQQGIFLLTPDQQKYVQAYPQPRANQEERGLTVSHPLIRVLLKKWTGSVAV